MLLAVIRDVRSIAETGTRCTVAPATGRPDALTTRPLNGSAWEDAGCCACPVASALRMMKNATSSEVTITVTFQNLLFRLSRCIVLSLNGLPEWRQWHDENEGKAPPAGVVQIRDIAESVARARQPAGNVVERGLDFDIAQPGLLRPLQESHSRVEFQIELVRAVLQVVRKSAAAVLIDDVKVTANPPAGVFRSQPLQVQLGFQFRRRAFDERLEDRLEGEAQARYGRGNIDGDHRFKDVLRLKLPDRCVPLAVRFLNSRCLNPVFPRKRGLNLQFRGTQKETFRLRILGHRRRRDTEDDKHGDRDLHFARLLEIQTIKDR